MSLDYQTHHIPLAAGMNSKADPRAFEPPELAKCINAEFDELGGIQKRKPYAAIESHIDNSIANIRRLAVYDGELVAFTKDGIWSYSSGDGRWTQRATYLAPVVTEKSRFINANTQTDCDRAELGGVVMFCWVENSGTDIYVAAIDSETGAVVLTPTIATVTGALPRLIALETKIHLYFYDTGSTSWKVTEYDPSNLGASTSTITISALSTAQFYDVCRNQSGDGTLWAQIIPGGTPSYTVCKISEGPTIVDSAGFVREAVGPIAIAEAPSGAIVVVRLDDANNEIRADLLTSALADDVVNITLGALSGTHDHITAAFQNAVDSQTGEYNCFAFWTQFEVTSGSDYECASAYVDTAGNAVSQNELNHRLCLASRAFSHDGRVFVWQAFVGENTSNALQGFRAALQNTYFLYRDDGELIAKAVSDRAGGLNVTEGRLPNVQNLGGNRYAFCGTERRLIELNGNHAGYEGLAPREVVIEFDSNSARRSAQIGETLYIAGGEIRQYDGMQLLEVGFHVYPWVFSTNDGGAGSVEVGTYGYKLTLRHENAKGELDRSTTAMHGEMVVSSSAKIVDIDDVAPLNVTHRSNPNIEYWRTAKNPIESAPFYLVSDVDPENTTAPNQYRSSYELDSLYDGFEDNFTDAVLITKQPSPENGGILPSLPPPSATVIAATADRLFLAGISDKPHRVVYSKHRGDGEVAAFSGELFVDVPTGGGGITGIAFLNETLIVFKERAIYALPGDGYDDTGGGQNYGPARLISADVGARSADTIALTPRGLMFHSLKGWYVLTQGWSVQYIGGAVDEFDGDEFTAVIVIESQHQVRCMSTSRVLCWDYLAPHPQNLGQWSEWTISDGLHAVIFGNRYTYATSNGADCKQEQDDWTGNEEAYSLDVETGWIKLAGAMGSWKCRLAMFLGEYRGAHRARVRVARDYDESDSGGPNWFDDKLWTPNHTTVGKGLQVRHAPSIAKCEAIKFRITDRHPSTDNPSITESFKLTALALKAGLKRGLYAALAAAQKQ